MLGGSRIRPAQPPRTPKRGRCNHAHDQCPSGCLHEECEAAQHNRQDAERQVATNAHAAITEEPPNRWRVSGEPRSEAQGRVRCTRMLGATVLTAEEFPVHDALS